MFVAEVLKSWVGEKRFEDISLPFSRDGLGSHEDSRGRGGKVERSGAGDIVTDGGKPACWCSADVWGEVSSSCSHQGDRQGTQNSQRPQGDCGWQMDLNTWQTPCWGLPDWFGEENSAGRVILSSKTYLLSTYYFPGTVGGSGVAGESGNKCSIKCRKCEFLRLMGLSGALPSKVLRH